MLPVYIIKTLTAYTDEKHPLIIQEIISLIENNYNETFERKAVSRCIKELTELDYDICYKKGYYLSERVLDKSELNYLCNTLIASPVLTAKQSKYLFNKLIQNESSYFKRKWQYIHNLSVLSKSINDEFFLTIEILIEAIENNKKVHFDYYQYGFDKKLHKRNEQGYIVSPYDMVIANEKYYLIANHEKYDNISYYRIDKIKQIRVLDVFRKNITEIEGYENGLNYPKHKMEHIYMFSGNTVKTRIKFNNIILDQIIDWFGLECNIQKLDDKYSILNVEVNENALKYWLKQYNDFVKKIE